MVTRLQKCWIGLMAILVILTVAGCGEESESAGAEVDSDAETASESTETSQEEEGATNEESTNEADQETEVVEEEIEEEEIIEPDGNSTYADYANYHVPLITGDVLTLSQESYDFIVNNHTLFPATTEETINEVKNAVDSSITVKHLNKNVTPYYSSILSFTGYVVSVEETPIEETDDVVAILHVIDDEDYSYEVLLYKSTGDIFEEDYVQFWGAPLGPSSFENISGGTTNVQEFMGSHIEKLQ